MYLPVPLRGTNQSSDRALDRIVQKIDTYTNSKFLVSLPNFSYKTPPSIQFQLNARWEGLHSAGLMLMIWRQWLLVLKNRIPSLLNSHENMSVLLAILCSRPDRIRPAFSKAL